MQHKMYKILEDIIVCNTIFGSVDKNLHDNVYTFYVGKNRVYRTLDKNKVLPIYKMIMINGGYYESSKQ